MDTQLLIGSTFEAGTEAEELILNPRTGARIIDLAEASQSQIERAVDAAEKAFVTWSMTTPGERSGYLLKIADAIEKDADAFAALEALNCGKPINAVRNDELPAIVDCWRFFAGAIRNLHATVAGEYLPGHTSMIRRDPVGIIGSIAPWNYPLMMMAWKLAPAIAGGNTVVFKPSEQTPLTALKMARLLADILPEGVVNVVLGRGDTVGNTLINHPKIGYGLHHRRYRHRQEGAAGGGKNRQAHPSGTRRQGPGHRLRRRRPRSRRQRRPHLRLLQCRPGLHRRLPHLCAGRHL